MENINNKELITDNIKIIYGVLKKMNLYNELDEYYDIGMIGLCKAARDFNSNKGYTFSTLAYRYIENDILGYIRKEKTVKRKSNYNAISLNTPVFKDGLNNEITLGETLSSNTNIEEELIKKEQINNLYIALSKLNEKEKNIISSLYGINGIKKLTQEELSEKYNISQTQISRIKTNCIKKLRKLLK